MDEFSPGQCKILHRARKNNAPGEMLSAEHMPTGITINLVGRHLTRDEAIAELEATVLNRDHLPERGRTRDELKEWVKTGRR